VLPLSHTATSSNTDTGTTLVDFPHWTTNVLEHLVTRYTVVWQLDWTSGNQIQRRLHLLTNWSDSTTSPSLTEQWYIYIVASHCWWNYTTNHWSTGC